VAPKSAALRIRSAPGRCLAFTMPSRPTGQGSIGAGGISGRAHDYTVLYRRLFYYDNPHTCTDTGVAGCRHRLAPGDPGMTSARWAVARPGIQSERQQYGNRLGCTGTEPSQWPSPREEQVRRSGRTRDTKTLRRNAGSLGLYSKFPCTRRRRSCPNTRCCETICGRAYDEMGFAGPDDLLPIRAAV